MDSLFNKQEALIIEDKVIQILDIVSSKGLSFENGLGLLGGVSGASLFFLECFKHFKEEKHLDAGIQILEEVISQSHLISNAFSFCDGLAGIGWLVGYAEECGYIEDSQNILEDVDNHIFEHFTIPMINQNLYDFLHGAIGSGIYFLTRTENSRTLIYIETLITSIAEKLLPRKSKFGLEYTSGNKKIQYDLGISHGIPAILYFLVSTFEAKIRPEQSLECIKVIVNFLLNNSTFPSSNTSYFPYYADDKGKTSRLAWCYGDLGICSVLLKASRAIKDVELENTVVEIIKHNSTRTNDPQNGVNDATFCHGSSGVAHIFSSWYQLYNIEGCKSAAKFWYNYTTKLPSPFFSTEGGYGAYRYKDSSVQENNSLLEGNVGVGLSLLSAINSDVKKWDRCLLLQ